MTARQRDKARKEGGRRGGAAKTPSKVEASRANGKKGGRRKKERHLEDFKSLGPPPTEPLQAASWVHRLLMIDLWRHVNDRGDIVLSSQLRATTTAMSKVMPLDAIVEAQRLIEEEQGKLSQEPGPGTVSAGELDGPTRSVGR